MLKENDLRMRHGHTLTHKATVSGRQYIFTVAPQSLNLQPDVHHPQRTAQQYAYYTWRIKQTGGSNQILLCHELIP